MIAIYMVLNLFVGRPTTRQLHEEFVRVAQGDRLLLVEALMVAVAERLYETPNTANLYKKRVSETSTASCDSKKVFTKGRGHSSSWSGVERKISVTNSFRSKNRDNALDLISEDSVSFSRSTSAELSFEIGDKDVATMDLINVSALLLAKIDAGAPQLMPQFHEVVTEVFEAFSCLPTEMIEHLAEIDPERTVEVLFEVLTRQTIGELSYQESNAVLDFFISHKSEKIAELLLKSKVFKLYKRDKALGILKNHLKIDHNKSLTVLAATSLLLEKDKHQQVHIKLIIFFS